MAPIVASEVKFPVLLDCQQTEDLFLVGIGSLEAILYPRSLSSNTTFFLPPIPSVIFYIIKGASM